jgi:carbon-monoxide dehydrogenase large subunit
MILHGQTHGGIAHGVGQALMERCMYDQDAGEVMIGSLMDYALPRAGDLPLLTTELSEVPSPNNALGVRSGGEGGTTPALAVVSNAVTDALAHLGVGRVALPITSANIWEAIRSAQEQRKEMVS